MATAPSVASPVRTYFGDPAQSLFGVLHVPTSGVARGGVVICPPLAKEQGDTTRGLKLLGDELAASGLVALRFDYHHTGESWGEQTDPGAAAAMVASVDSAVDFLRSVGVAQVAIVGLRAGALLAAQSRAVRSGIEALALWDPVIRGRSYIRGARSLYALAFDDHSDTDPLVHVVGASFHRGTAAALSAMRTNPTEIVEGIGAQRILVMPREPDMTTSHIAEFREAGVEVISAGDMTPFVQADSYFVDIPVDAIRQLAGWLDTRFGSARSPITFSARRETVIAADPSGPIRTRLVETPSGIALWETVGSDPTRTLVAHSTACDIRTGPARLWFDTAVTAARSGVRTIRYDRHGVGETDAVTLPDDFSPLHSAGARRDALEVATYAAELGGTRSPHVHAGVCSGAWAAADTALHADHSISVVLVNTLLWRAKRPIVVDQSRLEDPRLLTGAAALAMADTAAAQSQSAAPATTRTPLKARLKPVVRTLAPYWLWKMLGRAGVMMVPHLLLDALAKHDVETRLVFGPDDYTHFLTQRGADAINRIRARDADLSVVVTTKGDHPALHWRVREAAVESVLEALGVRQSITSDARPRIQRRIRRSSSLR